MATRAAPGSPVSTDAPEGAYGAKIRPWAAVLWNGVTLEELGVADLLKSVDFTLTLGRTPPSKKHPSGKPKVGGATLVFLVPNEVAGVKFREMLYFSPRPVLTVGFGFKDLRGYWLGETGVRKAPGKKQFGRSRGYKIDNVSWDYSASIPTLTLNGMSGQTLRLAEHRRPTVWRDTTFADVAKSIALENGVSIRISGSIPANQRLEHVVQYAGESRLEALERLAAMHGGTLHLTTEVAQSTPGVTGAYQYEFEGRSDEDNGLWGQDQAAVRTIVTIRSIAEDFVDTSQLDQTRPIRIAWAPHLSPAKFGWNNGTYENPPDYVATSIKPQEDNVARATPSSAGVKKSGGTEKGGIKAKYNVYDTKAFDGRFASSGVSASYANEVEIAPEKIGKVQAHASAVHDDLGGSALTAAQAQAALAAAGIRTQITIDLKPGAPEIDPGRSVEILGTFTHDGLHGVEEARNTWTRDGGLATTLTVRPILEGATTSGSSGKKKDKKPAPQLNTQEFNAYDPSREGGAFMPSSVKVQYSNDSPASAAGVVEGVRSNDEVPEDGTLQAVDQTIHAGEDVVQ